VTTATAAVLVVLLAASAAGCYALLAALRARLRTVRDAMVAELRRSGEAARTTGLSASYVGSTAETVSFRGNGILLVTEGRVWFRRALGGEFSIPLASVARTSAKSTFRGRPALGSGTPAHLVLELTDGTRVGFTVREIDDVRRAVGR
jgi:hypothetical protein